MRSATTMMLLAMGVIVSLMPAAQADFIVFVHGLAGFGRDELLGVGYWGFPRISFGTHEYIVEWMQSQTGLTAYEASVGPFSSNHDRACELYAQILGRRADYGKKHATANNHNRFGRDFSLSSACVNAPSGDLSGTSSYNKACYYARGGFRPGWGASDRVHLIGHSMGGQTIRTLERLLHYGLPSENDAAAYSGEAVPMSDLFTTQASFDHTTQNPPRDWIASVQTIATPHDGSVLHPKLDYLTGYGAGAATNLIKNVILLLKDALDNGIVNYAYNLDLSHHPDLVTVDTITGGRGALADWYEGVKTNPKFSTAYYDLADYDMSPAKWYDFNGAGPVAYRNTYYFAVSTYQTSACWLNNDGWDDQCVEGDANPLMVPTGNLMGDMDPNNGAFIGDRYSTRKFDDSWEANDGLVSRRSSKGPTYGVTTSYGSPTQHPGCWDWWGWVWSWYDYCYDTGRGINKGKWYWREIELDHVQAIGMTVFNFNYNIFNANTMDIYDHVRDNIKAVRGTY